ncbi:MAG: M24 family metallopeptidase, partial [Oscillospiraceae bacterium]
MTAEFFTGNRQRFLGRLSMNAVPTRAEEYAGQVREKYPAVQICSIAGILASLRSVKAPEEVECIRRAGDVTMEALRRMFQTARPGEYEYQWVADYAHHVARAGMREAFPTIAAAGSNA